VRCEPGAIGTEAMAAIKTTVSRGPARRNLVARSIVRSLRLAQALHAEAPGPGGPSAISAARREARSQAGALLYVPRWTRAARSSAAHSCIRRKDLLILLDPYARHRDVHWRWLLEEAPLLSPPRDTDAATANVLHDAAVRDDWRVSQVHRAPAKRPPRRDSQVKHRLVTEGARPFASRDVYSCVCGRRGSYVTITTHVATINRDRDNLEEDTKAHYVPIEPRTPAAPTPPPPMSRADIDAEATELPPPPSRATSIAEAFQNMLRQAFTAGRETATNETFESWYEREVLR
jgi:hypothetical protein